MNMDALLDQWREMGPVAWSQHKYGWIGEDKRAITLTPWQLALLTAYWERREDVSTLFISTVKKAGKTFLDSLLTSYRWLTIPSVHFVIGNDQDQSAELQFNMIWAMIQRHPVLSRYVKQTRDTLLFEPTGSRLVSLPVDFRGSSGANFATVSFTELWAYAYENANRLYEELTPIPLVDCLRIIDSYAGFEAESIVLKQVWDRGLTGQQISDQWPIFLTGRQLSYIHTGEDAQRRCWRGTDAQREAYYEEQQATLRPNTYTRIHENNWVSSESPFVPIEWWDRAATGQPVATDTSMEVVLGVDAGLKRDSAAVVAVTFDRSTGRAVLVNHRVFHPSPHQPLDIEDTLEDAVKEYRKRFRIKAVWYDPWQFQRSAQALTKLGIKMEEFPQTIPNLTAMTMNLYELLKGENLVAYADEDARKAVEWAVVDEGPRGMKITKIKTRHKIDFLVALAMAALGATLLLGQGPGTLQQYRSNPFWGSTWQDFQRERAGLTAEPGFIPHPQLGYDPHTGQLINRFHTKEGITPERCGYLHDKQRCIPCEAELKRRQAEARKAAMKEEIEDTRQIQVRLFGRRG